MYEKINSFLLCMDLQSFSHDCFSKILRTLFDFLNNTYWVSIFQRNNSLIFRTGVSCFSVRLFYFTLFCCGRKANLVRFTLFYSTLLTLTDGQTDRHTDRQTDRQTEEQIHSLRVGWRNLFSSCAVVSVLCSGGKQVLVLRTTYVHRVPYSCGVVLVFLVLAGNSFRCYVRTQCTIQLCGCVRFFCCGGKVNFVRIPYSHNHFSKILRTFFVKKLIHYKTYVGEDQLFLVLYGSTIIQSRLFLKILRTLFDFLNNTYWVSLFQRNNLLIFRTGVSCFSVTLF